MTCLSAPCFAGAWNVHAFTESIAVHLLCKRTARRVRHSRSDDETDRNLAPSADRDGPRPKTSAQNLWCQTFRVRVAHERRLDVLHHTNTHISNQPLSSQASHTHLPNSQYISNRQPTQNLDKNVVDEPFQGVARHSWQYLYRCLVRVSTPYMSRCNERTLSWEGDERNGCKCLPVWTLSGQAGLQFLGRRHAIPRRRCAFLHERADG
ncbi:hypothetical protein OE88DRAFT_254306 [Heliocybe sulcata]|uniref:Uncharacterized protein n=1 Tax=Heliocybe sulcata TaxID=5364 RepID=A0A5C3N9C4_9AGAM|nr:hypothetical protein OE88DRAFT_254306 [Heliocybe sulcata]